MNHVMKSCFGVALSFMALGPVAAEADDYKLVSNQRIACGRGLNPGKLNTATCKSYAYLFNSKTSEYFRCQVTLVMTRDNKERKVRGCITIASGLGTDVSKCLDMNFQ